MPRESPLGEELEELDRDEQKVDPGDDESDDESRRRLSDSSGEET